MKLTKIAALSMTALMVAGLACSVSAEEVHGDVNGDGKIIVGYISKNTVDPFHGPINAAAKEQIDQLKADGVIDDWTGILDGLTDAGKQVDLAADCIAQGVDYCIILPCEAVASDPAVVNMVEAGVKVVVVNSKTDSTDDLAITYCGSDDVYAGELMADYINTQVPDGGKYIHCQGVIGNSAQIQRGEGILNKIGENFECISDIPCDWAADKAVNAATDYMAQYGEELVAIICDNDDMSSAAQQACNEAGRTDIVCIGVDGNSSPLAMFKEGTLGATVLQDGVGQVTAGVNAIVADINGEAVEKEYSVPFVLVTSENVDEYLN